MNSIETDRSFGVMTTLSVVMLFCYCTISLSQQVARNYPVMGKSGNNAENRPAASSTHNQDLRAVSSTSKWAAPATPLRISSVYVVTNTDNAGAGSLRSAIDSANATPGLDVIIFNIPGSGVHTISPLSALPTIEDPVIIDGWTQPGFSGVPLIELSGQQAGTNINGLVLTGGSSTVRGLVINRFTGAAGSNGAGIALDVNGINTIEGNYIGTNAAGTDTLPNTGPGIGIFGTSTRNFIGGTTAQSRNVISGNSLGIGTDDIAGGGGGNVIRGNYIGVNATGTAILGNTGNGIYLNTPQDTIGGLDLGARNIISGNGYPGIYIDAFASETVVQGNYIGTDYTGVVKLGNLQNGIMINHAPNNLIGYTTPDGRNIISGNGYPGVYIFQSTGNTIQGNFIGINATGSRKLPNDADGITIDNAPNNTIGGPITGAPNVISGNTSPGIRILGAAASGNKIQGNYIGTNATASDTIGNGNGIVIDGAPNTMIGGFVSTDGNIISGNHFPAIFITNAGATGTQVLKNHIGTDFGGTRALPNSKGIVIDNAPGNKIGDENPADANLISGNTSNGIEIRNAGASGNSVLGNIIGTDNAGTADLGNGSDGIVISASQDTIRSNIIAYNHGSGVFVESGNQNTISRNSMFSNGALGIDLAPRGLARNDSLDIDAGANDLQNFPLLDSTSLSGSNITVHWRFNSKPNSNFVFDFYSCNSPHRSHFGEGKTFLAHTSSITSDASGNASGSHMFPFNSTDHFITATATDANGNTSEFSQALCLSDSDDDGILDSWETEGWGIDVNSDSTIDLDLHAMGAQPDNKDVFVEVDAMKGMAPQASTLQHVQDAFAVVPKSLVHNPNGAVGINLHIDISDTDLTLRGWPVAWWTEFHLLKSTFLGSGADRDSKNAENILAAKRLVYRYCIFAYQFDTTSWSGVSEDGSYLGADDFMVTLGTWNPPGGTPSQQAGTFMHELGHTLGLDHGGGDDINYKPNYISVMNYSWQLPFQWADTWRLDYSREELPTLDENHLDESVGLNPPVDSDYLFINVPYSGPHRGVMYAKLAPNRPVDWDSSGFADFDMLVAADLNIFDRRVSPGRDSLFGQEDWSNLIYNFRTGPAFHDAPPPSLARTSTTSTRSTIPQEMDKETFIYLNSLPPPKPRGQFVMDGQVDTSAILLASNAGINLYARYKAGQLYVATNSARSQGGDMFIVVSDSLQPLRIAPGGKNGQVSGWSVYLTNSLADNSVGWYDATGKAFVNNTDDTVGTVLEGVIDLELHNRKVPTNLFIAVGRYGSNAGGTLLAQVPVGNGDGNIDRPELVQFLGTPPPARSYFAQQGNKLVGSDVSQTYAEQGASVSLSADGNTAIIGGPVDDDKGAAWVFSRSGDTWSQQGPKLVGTGAAYLYDQFGTSVSISSDGNTSIVGGPLDTYPVGAAWIFTRTSNVWSQQGGKLVGTGWTGGGPSQGQSVAISSDGNTALIGGPADGSPSYTGATWVFTRSGSFWTQQGPKLVGAGWTNPAGQGSGVGLSSGGNTAIVGGGGAAWVFTRNGGVWSQHGPKLVGTDQVFADPYWTSQGGSVAISSDGNTVIAGGPIDSNNTGAAWVFTRVDTIWSQQGGKLVGTGAIGPARQGLSVALSGDGNTALVGGPFDNNETGAAWVFTRTNGVWTQKEGKIVGSGGVRSRQGMSVALSSDGSTAIIGGPQDDTNLGAAWIFTHDAPVVQLVSFTGIPLSSGQVRLDWTTVKEDSCFGFKVQRKTAVDSSFTTLAQSYIPGHGTTSIQYNYSFIDSSVTANHWIYRLMLIDFNATVHFGDPISVDVVTGVDKGLVPSRFALEQNYPDPFNPSTTITYQLPKVSHVTLKIYNMIGQEVATLVDGIQDVGHKSVVWNARNIASGVYFYRIDATYEHSQFIAVKKMLVLK